MLQVNEDSGNRRPIMLEAVDNPSSGASTSRRDEAASSSSSASKVSGEDSQGTSQEKPSKKAKKDKQDKESSGNNLSWQWSGFHLCRKIGFALIRSMIGLNNSPLFHPIRAKTKANRNMFSQVFSCLACALYPLHVNFFTLSFDWFMGLSMSFVIG